jgi:SAM-dependent methyltransferase
MTSKDTKEYWDHYYAGRCASLMPPSQFAAFVLGECGDHHFVLDVGCGNGRDALFFGSHGKRVLGIDGSPTAIELCRTAAAAAGIENVDFDTADVSSRDLEIKSAHHLKNNGAPLIYARFFIHAITEQEERKFLLFARSHLGQGTLAVEFRTMRDEALHKVTEGHYRRFVDPVAFAGRARDVGLDVVYLVEGFGMAKYKKDDAFVARVLLRRNAA